MVLACIPNVLCFELHLKYDTFIIFLNVHYVYNLHQKNGFTCMLLGEIFELVYVSYPPVATLVSLCKRFVYDRELEVPNIYVFLLSFPFLSSPASSSSLFLSPCSQLLFVVGFTVFLANCVDYDILFANKFVNHTDSSKVTLPDAFLPVDVCSAR